MGTGVEIGQAWVVMKMESWVISVCRFLWGLGCRTEKKGVPRRRLLIGHEGRELGILFLDQWPPICPSPASSQVLGGGGISPND